MRTPQAEITQKTYIPIAPDQVRQPTEDSLIRNSIRNIGGPFRGRGAAPAMVHDKVLPRGQRAAFEILNDAASMRGTIEDAGGLVAANDNNWGFAPGHYNSKCTDCRKWFTGAKRAWRCEPCSLIKAREYAA